MSETKAISTDTIGLVGKILEASGKESEKILTGIRYAERKVAFIDGYQEGVSEGMRRFQAKTRKLLGIFDNDVESIGPEEAWEEYQKWQQNRSL